jgi:hypothetical protein
MNRFWEEVRIISPVTWVIAVLVAVTMFFCLFFVAIPHDPKLSQWPGAGAVAFSIWPGALLFLVVMLIGYVNADARRRGMRYVMWTFIAVLLPNMLGVVLYFILRDPLVVMCPKCGAQGRASFAFCPQCGAELTRACPACKRSVDPGWNRCAYCGNALPTQAVK